MKKEQYIEILENKSEALAPYAKITKGNAIEKIEVNGKPVPVVTFFVENANEVKGKIPEKVKIGSVELSTRITEVEFQLSSANGESVWDNFLWADLPEADSTVNKSKIRPLKGGCSIITKSNVDKNRAARGTLGCFVVDNEDNTVCGLTNCHVVVQDGFLTKLAPDFVSEGMSDTLRMSNIVGDKVYQGNESDFPNYTEDDAIGVVKRYFPQGTFGIYPGGVCGPNTYAEGKNYANEDLKGQWPSAAIDAALISMKHSVLDANSWQQVGITDASFNASPPTFATYEEVINILYDTQWGKFATDKSYGDDEGRPKMIISSRTTGAKTGGTSFLGGDGANWAQDINIIAPMGDYHLGYPSDADPDGRQPILMRDSIAIGLQPEQYSNLPLSNPDNKKWIVESVIPGDSGSAVYVKIGNQWKILGLVYAATRLLTLYEIFQYVTGKMQTLPPFRVGIVCPMYAIADLLNVSPWDGNLSGHPEADIDNPKTIVLEGLNNRHRVIYNGEIYHLAGTVPASTSNAQTVEIVYDISSYGGIVNVIPNKDLDVFPERAPFEERDPLNADVGGSECPEGFTYDAEKNKCVANRQCPVGYTYDSAKDACVINTCPEGYVFDELKGACVTEEKILYISAVSREIPDMAAESVNHENRIKIGKGKYIFQLGNNSIPRNTDKGYVITTDIPEENIVGVNVNPGSTLTNDDDSINGTTFEHYFQKNQPIKNSFAYEGNTSTNGIVRYSDNSIQVYPFFKESEGAHSDFSSQRIAVEIDAPFSTFTIGIPGRGYEAIKLEYDAAINQDPAEAHFPSIETSSLLDVKPYCSALKTSAFEAHMIYPIYRFQDLAQNKLLHLAASRFIGWPSWEDLNYKIEQYRGYQIDDTFHYDGIEDNYINSASYYELSVPEGEFFRFTAGTTIDGKIGDHQFSYTVPSNPTEDTVMAGIATEISKGANLTATYSLGGITIKFFNDGVNIIGYNGNGGIPASLKSDNNFTTIVKWLDPDFSSTGVGIGWLSGAAGQDFNAVAAFSFRVMKQGNLSAITSQQRYKELYYHNSATLIPLNALYNKNTVYGKKYGPYNPRVIGVNENGRSPTSWFDDAWAGAVDGAGRTQFSNWNQYDGVFDEPANGLEAQARRTDPYAIPGTTKWSQVAYSQYYVLNPNWTEGDAAIREKWNIPSDDSLTTPLWHKFTSINWAFAQDSLKIDANINLDILKATSYTAYYSNNNNEFMDDIKYSWVQNKG